MGRIEDNNFVYILTISIIVLIILNLTCIKCSVDTHKDNYGIKVIYKVPWFGPHGRSVAKLYYKSKLISSNLFYAEEKSYRLSPDKNMILFIEYSLHARRYGIYVIPEDKTIYFHQTTDMIGLRYFEKEYHKIKWEKEKIVISHYSDECILHINDNILEKCRNRKINNELTISFNSLYEYLLILIKQLYERIDQSDQQKYHNIFEPYLKKLPIKDYYNEVSSLKLKDNKHHFDEIGETFNILVEKLNPKYSKIKMYQIFSKNFHEKFELIDFKVKLRRKGLLW